MPQKPFVFDICFEILDSMEVYMIRHFVFIIHSVNKMELRGFLVKLGTQCMGESFHARENLDSCINIAL